MHCIGRFPEKPEIAAGVFFFLLIFYLKYIAGNFTRKKYRVVVVFYSAAATIRTKTGPEITAV